jgi:monoamine oxidase
MSLEKSGYSRREFLKNASSSAASSALLRAASAMGLLTATTSCGSSSDASPATPTPAAPIPPPSNIVSPRPSDWPTNIGNGKTVIILGAGIAGMSAAYELNTLGYQVTILEANGSAGGRCRTIRSGDSIEEIDSVQTCDFDADDSLYFNPGPARIPNHHDLLLGYCREFEVALEPFINSNYAALFHSQTAAKGQSAC